MYRKLGFFWKKCFCTKFFEKTLFLDEKWLSQNSKIFEVPRRKIKVIAKVSGIISVYITMVLNKKLLSPPGQGRSESKILGGGAHIFQKCPLYLVLSGFKTKLYLVLSGSQNLLIMAKKPWLWPSYLQNVLKMDFEIFSLLWRNFEAFYAPNMAFLSKILKKFHMRRFY